MGRRQHTVPRFYLNRFVHPGFLYERGFKQAKKVLSANKVAVRDFYYSEDGEGKNSIDYINTIIENEAAPILKTLITEKGPIESGVRLLFSYFIANLFLRAPSIIEETGKAALKQIETASDMAKKIVGKKKIEIKEEAPYINFEGKTYTYKEWEKYTDSLKKKAKKGKAMMNVTMSLCVDFAPVIAKMSWAIFDAKGDAFFVTSDCPVFLTNLDGSTRGRGWEKEDAVATLPLSPRRLLILYGSPLGGWMNMSMSAEEVKAFNERTISGAKYAIFSPKRYNLAEKWLREKVDDEV